VNGINEMGNTMTASTELEKHLLRVLKTLVSDFDAIGEDESIPDSINDVDHWDEAKALVALAEGKDHYVSVLGERVPL